MLEAALAELPSAPGEPGAPIAALLVAAGLTTSVGESRRAIAQGGVYVDNERIGDAEAVLGPMLHGRFAVLRRGKRTLAAVVRPL
jgi:tyrosyl-tRNA synthetase